MPKINIIFRSFEFGYWNFVWVSNFHFRYLDLIFSAFSAISAVKEFKGFYSGPGHVRHLEGEAQRLEGGRWQVT